MLRNEHCTDSTIATTVANIRQNWNGSNAAGARAEVKPRAAYDASVRILLLPRSEVFSRSSCAWADFPSFILPVKHAVYFFSFLASALVYFTPASVFVLYFEGRNVRPQRSTRPESNRLADTSNWPTHMFKPHVFFFWWLNHFRFIFLFLIYCFSAATNYIMWFPSYSTCQVMLRYVLIIFYSK